MINNTHKTALGFTKSHLKLNIVVALKLIKPELNSNPDITGKKIIE